MYGHSSNCLGPAGHRQGTGGVVMGMTTEERMKWTERVLGVMWTYAPDKEACDALIGIRKVLEHGAQKHGSRPHRGAVVDLKHALAHLLEESADAIDPDTGQYHWCQAAADCLLALGDLVGMVK